MTTSIRTTAAIQARRATTDEMVQRVTHVLKQMRREHATVTIAAVARRAGVSRTFLYQNTAARELVAASSGDHPPAHPTDMAATQIEATWRERALNAEHELKRAHDEIALQRTRIGEQLGHIRDLENDLPADGVQQLLTETRTLKARVRKLTEDNIRLQERLTGARDNNRFLDKRIADLEAELADHVTLTAHGRARPNGLAE